MLISFLLSFFEFVITLIIGFVSNIFPQFSILSELFAFGLSLVADGMKIVSFFFLPGDLLTLCDIWIVFFTLDHSMDIVFFVLRKIPFLNIK